MFYLGNDKRISALALFLFSSLLIIFLITQILPWENAIITVHDNLDSNHVYYKTLMESGLLYSGGDLDSFLELDRNTFPSELNLATQLYNIFPPLTAYYSILILKVLIAVTGMYLCLTSDLIKLDKTVAFGVGCAFAVLPGHPASYLAQSSVPLIFYMVYFGFKVNNLKMYIASLFVLFSLSFLSSLFLYGVFVLITLSFLFLFLFLLKYEKSSRIAISIIILSLGFIISEYRIFELQLFGGYVSLREEILRAPQLFLNTFINIITKGQYHSEIFAINVYYVASIIIIFYVLNYFLFKRKLSEGRGKLILLLLSLYVIFAVIASFSHTAFFYSMAENYKLISLLNWSRFTFIMSFFLYIMLGVLLCDFNKFLSLLFVILLISFNMMKPAVYNDFKKNFDNMTGESNQKYVTYKEFYGEEVFSNLKNKINYNHENSLAVGFYPSVLKYNKISTLDGYFSYAPLSRKHLFRTLISPQLESNIIQKSSFDNWGARMYAFEDSNNFKKTNKYGDCEPIELKLDMNVFKSIGGEYIFSICKLKNMKELGLTKVSEAFWRPYSMLYLYKIKNKL
ncbi:DUF6044 family protein [Aliivibrio sifiae]|uniref:Glycosyltransferase RgtA/B/C/D-like domain-containing protein n=1 Tax=Aliivibrio sifiae TaxID=566293 RepID=A0A2S7X0I3_9GAMM|nr:DUF6044 family protein [Aliivibrio sifiae]PQJ83344.1 hypothetical protein BTO22_18320 [Aliivibrio sifiae]